MKLGTQSFMCSLAGPSLTVAAIGTNPASYAIDPDATWLGFMNLFQLPFRISE